MNDETINEIMVKMMELFKRMYNESEEKKEREIHEKRKKYISRWIEKSNSDCKISIKKHREEKKLMPATEINYLNYIRIKALLNEMCDEMECNIYARFKMDIKNGTHSISNLVRAFVDEVLYIVKNNKPSCEIVENEFDINE